MVFTTSNVVLMVVLVQNEPERAKREAAECRKQRKEKEQQNQQQSNAEEYISGGESGKESLHDDMSASSRMVSRK